jgi:hypothetical protein
VAAFDRNRWPLWIGLGGRLPSESLAALPRNPHAADKERADTLGLDFSSRKPSTQEAATNA